MSRLQFDNNVFNVRPVPLETPQNALANALMLAKAQQEYESNALSLQNARQSAEIAKQNIERENALAKLISQGNYTPEQLYGVGGIKLADAYLKSKSDRAKVDAEVANKMVDTKKGSQDLITKQISMQANDLVNVKTPQDMANWVIANYNDPITGEFYKSRGKLQDALTKIPQSPEEFEEFKQKLGLGMKDYILQSKPQFTTRNLGGTTDTIAIDGLTGKTRVVNSAINTQSPDNAASNARMAADAAASRAVTMRGQDMTDARSRESNAIAMGLDGGISQMGMNKQFGKPPAGFRWKQDGGLEAIPGGPSDQKAQNIEAGKQTVDSVVATLRNSYNNLDKNGGITSTEQGVASNLSRALSRSGVGQVVGGAIGSTNQKERDSIAQARPLLMQAIMKATGMSAKQMDSNTELKLYLSTATDPTLSLQANREALDRIESLYGSGANSANQPKPASGGWGIQRIK